MVNSFDLNEKSACGVGFVASRKGAYEHHILQQGLHALCCEEHRGGCNVDQTSADGAGIMTDIPFELLGYKKGEVAVASLFLPIEAEIQRRSLRAFEEAFEFVGLKVLEYRPVPVDKSILGESAAANLPAMLQAIIKRPKHCRADYSFDRLLYQAKQYNRIQQKGIEKNDFTITDKFFFTSLSANTIVYKGLVKAADLSRFYVDLQNSHFKTRFALFHRRFSTNTVSTWDKAQPFRIIAHNGEINTIQGNRSWAFSREKALGLRRNELLNHYKVSDSGSLNEMVEALAFRSAIPYIEDALAILMPPSTLHNKFYQFWSRAMEPWDGPALITFSTGTKIGARLDRNGFRPCRWASTQDYFYLSSEAGSFGIDEASILEKGTLNAGTGVTIDLHTGDLNFQDPSRSRENIDADFDARLIPFPNYHKELKAKHLDKKYLFNYSEEDLTKVLAQMIATGKEAIGSMGDTARLKIFSDEPRSFFDHFYQTFAQVTNPPLDYLREKNVTDMVMYLGKKPNIFSPKEMIPVPLAFELKSPLLSLGQMSHILEELTLPETSNFRLIAQVLDISFPAHLGAVGFQKRLDEIGKEALKAVSEKRASILVLSDRKASYDKPPIPSLLALRAVINALTEAGARLETSIVVDSGEIVSTHHAACLIAFGATAICPYLALEIARFEQGHKLSKIELSADEKENNLLKAYHQGILKIMSKMGISVLRSYQSSKLFSIIGLHDEITNHYFSRTHALLGGLKMKDVVDEILDKTKTAQKAEAAQILVNTFLYREDTIGQQGEKHAMTLQRSKIIHALVRQTGLKINDLALYDQYLKSGNSEESPLEVRHLFSLKAAENKTQLTDVEDVSNILKRFGSGAMSFGAISAESQRDIILAMQEIGGRSNSGEGGENPYYFTDGISANTKQIASARFGVTALYAVSGLELQIKVAQGAKPGEGGQLMAIKVNADIARARYANKNVDLISPPPLHDIYSIEDLKQLIYELRQLHPTARISVKLVSGFNIGTIAVGVAKAGADIIDIVGGNGGTGAAGLSSMKHAGLPWEFGLVEAHEALIANGLRKYIKLRTDGGLHTGEDVVLAALLGAEEFNFGKLLLVAQGCVMARICEKNTCPAGITTHDPVYKAKYKGNKNDIVTLLHYIAEDVRQKIANMGFSSLSQLIGRMDLLTPKSACNHLINTRNLDLSFALGKNLHGFQSEKTPFAEDLSPLNAQMITETKTALDKNENIDLSYSIKVTDRAVLAALAGEIARKENLYRKNFHLDNSLYPYTKEMKVTLKGSAGQGFGVFLSDGMNIKLYGEANDSVAKTMSGGKMVICPPKISQFEAEKNVIIGNCALYGATGGVLYVHGIAGDRFAVRNSGAYAVVEGTGLHACEYMTNGKVIILGEYQENVGSGMTGGELYLYQPHHLDYINDEYLEQSEILQNDWDELHNIIFDYLTDTNSATARFMLSDWVIRKEGFVKFIPKTNSKKIKTTENKLPDKVRL